MASSEQPAERRTAAEPPQPPAPLNPEERSSADREHPELAAHLHERYPDVPDALIEQSIDDALLRYRDARVRSFLPILLERAACEALEQAVGSGGFTCD